MKKNKEIDYTKRVPVEVEWFDAQIWTGTAEEFGEIISWKPLKSHTCGYLVHEDKKKIIISFLNFGDETTKYFQMIPKGMVKKITKLEETKANARGHKDERN